MGKLWGFWLSFDNGTDGLATHDIKNSQNTVISDLESVENLFVILLLKTDFIQTLGCN